MYITFFFVPFQEQKVEALINNALSNNPSGIAFTDITDFSWDYACLIGSYDSKEQLLSDYNGFLKQERHKYQSSIGLDIDYASFINELPKMKPLGRSWGLYYDFAFMFLKDARNVRSWRLTRAFLVLNEEKFIWHSQAKTTCLSDESAMLVPQITSNGIKQLTFKQKGEE